MKILYTLLLLLFAGVTTYGQNAQKDFHELEVICGLGNIRGKSVSILKETFIPSVNISYNNKVGKNIGIGIGGGYNHLKLAPMAGAISNDYKCREWSAFGTVRGYLPMSSERLTIVCILDAGISYLNTEIKPVPKEIFTYSPQLGIRLNTADVCGVNLNFRFFYKEYPKLEAGTYGLMLGISF